MGSVQWLSVALGACVPRSLPQRRAALPTLTMGSSSSLPQFAPTLAMSTLGRSLGFTTKPTSCGTPPLTPPSPSLSALTQLSSWVISVSSLAVTQACSQSARQTYQQSPWLVNQTVLWSTSTT